MIRRVYFASEWRGVGGVGGFGVAKEGREAENGCGRNSRGGEGREGETKEGRDWKRGLNYTSEGVTSTEIITRLVTASSSSWYRA